MFVTMLMSGASLQAMVVPYAAENDDVEMTVLVSVPRSLRELTLRIGPFSKPFLEVFNTLTSAWYREKKRFSADIVAHILEFVCEQDVSNFMRVAYSSLPSEAPEGSVAFMRKDSFEQQVIPSLASLNDFPKKWVLLAIAAFISTGTTFAWVIYDESDWSWWLFTSVAILGLWPAMKLPYYVYKITPFKTDNCDAKWLIWLLSRGKYKYDI